MRVPDNITGFSSSITAQSKILAVITTSVAMTLAFISGLLYRSYGQQSGQRSSNLSSHHDQRSSHRSSNMSSQDSIGTRRSTAMNALQVALIEYEQGSPIVVNRIHDENI
jgi:hypothetical protein